MSLEDVAVHLTTNNTPAVEKHLQTLLANPSNVTLENTDVIKRLLQCADAQVLQLAAQTVAELAKSAKNRNVLTAPDVLQSLLKQTHLNNAGVVYQTLRAIGNICFENASACALIGEGGLQQILAKVQGKEGGGEVLFAGWGCLVNLLSTSEALGRVALLKLRLLDVIEGVLRGGGAGVDEGVVQQLLVVLNAVSDEVGEAQQGQLKRLCYEVIRLMKSTANLEIGALCLEFLFSQAESQQFRVIFAEEGICELIYELVEKYSLNVNSEEARAVLKMACDLIVIILTEDECMELLYKEGEGTVYKNMLAWLDYDDTDLMTTAVLALGNFARKDANCIQMVERGLAKKLLDLLAKHNNSANDDMKVQHAILSTLKNLAIPKQNKRALLDDGLIGVLYPLLESNHEIVIFKLLGTFRMVIDGQENAALKLITDQKLLERLMDWCYNSNHLGVRGEVPRLIAWLIKNCHSFQPISLILSTDKLVRCLVEMISSNHAIMQNEAYFALNILSLGSKNENSRDFVERCISADIGKHFHYIVGKYADKPDVKSTENLLCLLENLTKSPRLVEHLKLCGVKEALLKLENKEKLDLILERF